MSIHVKKYTLWEINWESYYANKWQQQWILVWGRSFKIATLFENLVFNTRLWGKQRNRKLLWLIYRKSMSQENYTQMLDLFKMNFKLTTTNIENCKGNHSISLNNVWEQYVTKYQGHYHFLNNQMVIQELKIISEMKKSLDELNNIFFLFFFFVSTTDLNWKKKSTSLGNMSIKITQVWESERQRVKQLKHTQIIYCDLIWFITGMQIWQYMQGNQCNITY